MLVGFDGFGGALRAPGDTEENQDKHDEGDRWAPADWDAYAYAEAQEWGAMRGEDEEPPQPMEAVDRLAFL